MQVVELVDTRDLKSLEGNFVPVQVRLWAPERNMNTMTYISTFVTELQSRIISSLLIVILITSSALALALYLDDQYKSQALLKHSEDSLNNGFAPSSPIGGIAALSGINLGQGSIDPIDYSIEVIKSREF